MDLTQLRSFLKIAEYRSFTRAAKDFGVSQPALSQQIAKLEADLGRPIFERQGRQISLTEAGELLKRQAEQIISLADDTAKLLCDDGESGKVIVSAIPTIAPYLLPSLIRTFHGRHPRAHIEIHEEVTESILKRCAMGEIDVGILALPVERAYLKFERLFEEELVLVLPTSHELVHKPEILLEDLQDEPFVLLDEAHCLSGHIRSFCQRRAVQPVTTGRTQQLSTVQELVSLELGVSLIPEMARRVDSSDRRVYRSLSGKVPTRTIAACWNADRYQSRLAKRFLDALREMKQEAEPGD
ncbi:LysR family transcriptional regulator [Singulisphaera sp. PoT]|uniref:LysR family transcriptional regulator n=1 Tax=Singulisphaera sp. PoT TaxID=3411797 RepID=UPI003BF4850F